MGFLAPGPEDEHEEDCEKRNPVYRSSGCESCIPVAGPMTVRLHYGKSTSLQSGLFDEQIFLRCACKGSQGGEGKENHGLCMFPPGRLTFDVHRIIFSLIAHCNLCFQNSHL